MEPFYTVSGKSEYALVNVELSIVKKLLENDRYWGASTLEMAGEFGWKVLLARLWSGALFSSGIISESTDGFIVYRAFGKQDFLAYRITKESESSVRVTPFGYLPQNSKVWIVIGLAVCFILPVMLSPIIWKSYELSNLRYSRVYQDAFCRYLQDQITLSEIERDWSQLAGSKRR